MSETCGLDLSEYNLKDFRPYFSYWIRSRTLKMTGQKELKEKTKKILLNTTMTNYGKM